MPNGERPGRAAVLRAIELFLGHAYEGPAPAHVVERVKSLERCTEDDFYECSAFEKEPEDGAPTRYALRLGNRHYPHMKLVVERMPNRDRWFFRADSHDEHICPAPGDPEHDLFRALMERNREVAGSIEGAWAREGVPTFREFLRSDLERRRQGRNAPP